MKCRREMNVGRGLYFVFAILLVLVGIAQMKGSAHAAETLQSPTNVRVQGRANQVIAVGWNKVPGATDYMVYRSTDSKRGFRAIGTTKQNLFYDTSKKSICSYYYRVVALKKGATTIRSGYKGTVAFYMKPVAPSVNGVSAKNTVTLSWNQVAGARFYFVYRKNAKGGYDKIGQTGRPYFTDTRVKAGNTYSYRVFPGYSRDYRYIIGYGSKVFSITASSLDPSGKMVALTFDDGPGPYTQSILNCLKQNDAKATFFVVGSRVDAYKGVLANANAIGCEIGSHTYSHAMLPSASDAEIRSQMSMTDQKIQNAIGKKADIMRTPGGATNDRVKSLVGKPIILWSIDTLDWKTRNRDKTVSAVMNNVKDGDIVLMHDIHKPSEEAALILIPRLRQQGYQLVTVSELARYRGVQLRNGGVYHSFRR